SKGHIYSRRWRLCDDSEASGRNSRDGQDLPIYSGGGCHQLNSAVEDSEGEPFVRTSSRTEHREYAARATRRARGQAAPYSGALESLAERAAAPRSRHERYLDLLGLTDLSTQTRSGYRELRRGGRYRYMDLWPHPWSTPLRQP